MIESPEWTKRVGLITKINFSEYYYYGHFAYQMKGNEAYNSIANILPYTHC